MQLFNTPKATITRLKNNTSNTNKAQYPDQGEVALVKQIYFKPINADQNLFNALEQLKTSPIIRTHQIRFLFVTDYQSIEAYDCVAQDSINISFTELYKEYAFFLPLISGYEKATITSENPADTKAAEKMGRLFDSIQSTNQLDTHELNLFLTRLLFCFFAEDTGIFEKQAFKLLIKDHCDLSGSQLKALLKELFGILNTEESLRKNTPSHLAKFPYVNGGLFADNIHIPEFNARAFRILLGCANLDWSEINPDIFGSMFQAVIDPQKRAELGQHYTSVANIMKIIKPLFLDNLYEELEHLKTLKLGTDKQTREKGLQRLLARISNIKIFDPACGSGNFLIIAYKELRKLEIDIFKAFETTQSIFSNIHLDQFYGLEIDDFACETARLSMWLAEHQMNVLFEKELGVPQLTLPLKDSGRIFARNSLRENWEVFCPRESAEDEVYLISNPPFVRKQGRTTEQTKDMELVFSGIRNFRSLDYVTSWFWKGANYITNSNAKLAFVATNSICQGEQVSILWNPIFNLGLSIQFAYQSFIWANNARDKAAVHTIIIGLSSLKEDNKLIFKEVDKENLLIQRVNNISPYLFEGSNITISRRMSPICSIPSVSFGNMPNDGGNLLLTLEEKETIISTYPNSEIWFKKILGADEFLNNQTRFCLWLVNIKNNELEKIPPIKKRIEETKKIRLQSQREATKILASTPHLFGFISQPTSGNYILIPGVSSENRPYIPIGFMDHNIICTNANFMLPNATLYEFAILTSEMHNDWMRVVAGRLKSDYRYSNTLVYNTFPFPEVTEEQKKQISELAEEVLLVRDDFPDMTLAQLYNPETMPESLKQAHKTLDKAVEKLYREKPFADSSERVAFLFQRYEALIKAEQKGNQ
ncbi:class I SAM-dependent DNA methyltransferase [Rodentibacter ratti]|uniref:class I SAM-dependent DNA methyltransferase n=1 Tax=Rodentibacter ratti TaxID=1906745 RepID=UPI001C5BCD0C|nr:DNA methyltransferase [Rodentibacter ratti]